MMTLRYSSLIMMMLSFAAAPRLLEAAEEDFLTIEPDIVCRRQAHPSDTLCPKLEHLRLRLGLDWNEALSFRLAYDAQHQTKVSWHNSYGLNVQRLTPRSTWLDDYGLRLRLSSSVELGIEDWAASTLIPDASGLGFSRLLQDSGWNQSALRLTYLNPDIHILAASLIVGQGEGERFEERDASPYVGALARLSLGEGFSFQGGWSIDRDYLHPDALFWLEPLEAKRLSRGFSASRLAASFLLDGSHPLMRGLRLSLGWQKNHIEGPGQQGTTLRAGTGDGPFDPTELLAETLGGKSDLDRQTWLVSGSYEILSSFILAFHAQRLTVDLGGDKLLSSCSNLDGEGRCIDPAVRRDFLAVQSTTFGLGKKSDQGWSLMLESMHESYDRLYELYHFAPGRDQRQRSLQILQVRLSARL